MRESRNRILDFLTSKAKPTGDACRSNPRRSSSARVELAWFDGKDWRRIPARLRDISQGGAGLLARSAPPLTRRARLRIAEGEGSGWVEAEIIGVEPHTPTRHRIRIQFSEPCPNIVLRLAVLGADLPVERQDSSSQWAAWTPTA